MSLNRYAARRDDAEKAVCDALEAQGCQIRRLSGRGVPDLVVTRGGQMWLCEVKGPSGKLTPDQKAWRLGWNGPPILILRCVDDAIELVRYGPAGLET